MIGAGKKYSLSEADLIPETRRELANGAVAGYVNVDGKRKWAIVSGANVNNLNAARALRGSKKISSAQAQRAFNRYYKQRDYKNERSRKAAITRDMRSSSKKASRTTDTRRYLQNPGRLDYPGLDDGPNRSNAVGNAAALEAYRASGKRPAARRSAKEARRSIRRQSGGQQQRRQQQQQQQQQQRRQQQQQQQQQQGGRVVSLKTAVKLLRSYYSQRYGRQQ